MSERGKNAIPNSFETGEYRLDQIRETNQLLINDILIEQGSLDGGSISEEDGYKTTVIPRSSTFSADDVSQKYSTVSTIEVRHSLDNGSKDAPKDGKYQVIFHDYVVGRDGLSEYDSTTYKMWDVWADTEAERLDQNNETSDWKPDKEEELDLQLYLLTALKTVNQRALVAA